MSIWTRVRNVFRGERMNREIQEEMEAHLAEAVAQGRDPVEARRAFGSSLRRGEESHSVRVMGWLDSLRADVVFGWRQLMKRKVTTGAAVLSLALAIGACTAAFLLGGCDVPSAYASEQSGELVCGFVSRVQLQDRRTNDMGQQFVSDVHACAG